MSGQERLGDRLLLELLPCVAAPNTFMSLPPSMGVESEFCPPVLE